MGAREGCMASAPSGRASICHGELAGGAGLGSKARGGGLRRRNKERPQNSIP